MLRVLTETTALLRTAARGRHKVLHFPVLET